MRKSGSALALMGMAMTLLFTALPQGALTHECHAKSTPIVAEGANHVFTAGEAIIKCGIGEFNYTGAIGKFGAIDVSPIYKECLTREIPVSIKAEGGAAYEFSTLEEVKSNEFSVVAALVGPTGAKIKISATIEGETCETSIPVQAIAGKSTKIVNNSGKTGAAVKAKMEKISFTSNNLCAGLIPKEGKNAKYEGSASETGLIVE